MYFLKNGKNKFEEAFDRKIFIFEIKKNEVMMIKENH